MTLDEVGSCLARPTYSTEVPRVVRNQKAMYGPFWSYVDIPISQLGAHLCNMASTYPRYEVLFKNCTVSAFSSSCRSGVPTERIRSLRRDDQTLACGALRAQLPQARRRANPGHQFRLLGPRTEVVGT